VERDLKLISTSLFAWGIGEGLFVYFLPLSLQDWGANPLLIGAVYSGIGVAIALAQIPAGYLSDRIGARYIMYASWTIGVISTWIMALAQTFSLFIVGVWTYYLTAFVVAPMNSYITQLRGKWSVSRALTFASGSFNLGAVAGPILGGLIADHLGIRQIYLFSAIIFIISTTIIVFLKPQKILLKNEDTEENGHLFRNQKFITFLSLSFFSIMFIYLPQPLTPNYLQNQIMLDRTTIGLLGTIGNLGNAFATLILGILPSTIGLFLGQIMVAGFSILLWKGQTIFSYGLAYFLLGGYRLNRSMIVSKIQSFVKEKEVGLAFGILETVSGFAVILAPVVAGSIFSRNALLVYPIGFILICLAIIANGIFFYCSYKISISNKK
jgi:DHA1 family multidrug resistance protein-like MFS transporter